MTEHEEPRSTTVHNRYHIASECLGLVETARTRAAAFDRATWYLSDDPDLEVFDVMARKGMVDTWAHRNGHWGGIHRRPSLRGELSKKGAGR